MSMFTFTQDQNVPAGQSVMFNNVICCNKGYVLHENGSSVVTLRGVHSTVDKMIASLKKSMGDATSEYEKQEIQEEIHRLRMRETM